MIRIPDVRLAATHKAQLRVWQEEVSSVVDYVAGIKAADKEFKRRNRANNKTFAAVRETLARMCSGAQRCVYCEDSAGVEVEHLKPKAFYPQLVFVFENYVFGCGRCNKIKSNRVAVFDAAGNLIKIVRGRDQTVTPPSKGRNVLINPRKEDATQWLMLDLRDTFEFVPVVAPGTLERKRADYLLEVLPLNDPAILVPARREAHDNYRARLVEYIVRRDEGASASELKKLTSAIKRMQHPTVWFEIKRQSSRLRDWQPLFAKAPEALAW